MALGPCPPDSAPSRAPKQSANTGLPEGGPELHGAVTGLGERRWLQAALGLLWVFSCSALGAALMVLPWLTLWERNYLLTWAPGWSAVWLSPYTRGAVTGLGVVNVGISFCELLRLWGWWPSRQE